MIGSVEEVVEPRIEVRAALHVSARWAKLGGTLSGSCKWSCVRFNLAAATFSSR